MQAQAGDQLARQDRALSCRPHCSPVGHCLARCCRADAFQLGSAQVLDTRHDSLSNALIRGVNATAQSKHKHSSSHGFVLSQVDTNPMMNARACDFLGFILTSTLMCDVQYMVICQCIVAQANTMAFIVDGSSMSNTQVVACHRTHGPDHCTDGLHITRNAGLDRTQPCQTVGNREGCCTEATSISGWYMPFCLMTSCLLVTLNACV